MTIIHWPPSTGHVQPIENGCFTGSTPVWPTLFQAYSQKPGARLAAYTWRDITNEVQW
jgi:hypothetical protein